jgi:hypothetical protein
MVSVNPVYYSIIDHAHSLWVSCPSAGTSDRAVDAQALCASQVDLIGVVMVALLLYVTNLVISLFRIFEKVKIRQGWGHKR